MGIGASLCGSEPGKPASCCLSTAGRASTTARNPRGAPVRVQVVFVGDIMTFFTQHMQLLKKAQRLSMMTSDGILAVTSPWHQEQACTCPPLSEPAKIRQTYMYTPLVKGHASSGTTCCLDYNPSVCVPCNRGCLNSMIALAPIESPGSLLTYSMQLVICSSP